LSRPPSSVPGNAGRPPSARAARRRDPRAQDHRAISGPPSRARGRRARGPGSRRAPATAPRRRATGPRGPTGEFGAVEVLDGGPAAPPLTQPASSGGACARGSARVLLRFREGRAALVAASDLVRRSASSHGEQRAVGPAGPWSLALDEGESVAASQALHLKPRPSPRRSSNRTCTSSWTGRCAC
jgi:hypothetical protein